MGSRRASELSGHLETLFRFGTASGLSDVELLDRFVSGRDEAGEANFRAACARHGPMVLRVCRSVLDDPHDAEDAFQVTFLAPGAEGRLDSQTGFAGELAARDRPSGGLQSKDGRPKACGAASRTWRRESPAADASSESRLTPSRMASCRRFCTRRSSDYRPSTGHRSYSATCRA